MAAIFLLAVGQPIHAATGNKTKKLNELTTGQVVKIGGVSFVKTASNQLVATSLCPQGSSYSSYFKGCVVKTTTFDYTGDYQTFTAPATGTYVVELWGASGGNGHTSSAILKAGLGAYVSGHVNLIEDTDLYLYIGARGEDTSGHGWTEILNGGWNGGGMSGTDKQNDMGGSGGGGSDVRLISGAWNDMTSLASRIIVAGASGGGAWGTQIIPTMYAGGLDNTNGTDGTTSQTSGYAFGYGQNGKVGGGTGSAGGGGGWWGGITQNPGHNEYWNDGQGGSSYISGHTGCVAVTSLTDTTPKAGCDTGTSDRDCSLSPTGYSFTNTIMIDGHGYSWTNTKGDLAPMPDPTSVGSYYDAGVGHTGNGAARITQLSVYLGI